MASTDQLKKKLPIPLFPYSKLRRKKSFFSFRRSICFNVSEKKKIGTGGVKGFFFIFGTLGALTALSKRHFSLLFVLFRHFFWGEDHRCCIPVSGDFFLGRGGGVAQKSGHFAPLMHLHFPDKKVLT